MGGEYDLYSFAISRKRAPAYGNSRKTFMTAFFLFWEDEHEGIPFAAGF